MNGFNIPYKSYKDLGFHESALKLNDNTITIRATFEGRLLGTKNPLKTFIETFKVQYCGFDQRAKVFQKICAKYQDVIIKTWSEVKQ